MGISIETFTGLIAKLQVPVNLLTIVKSSPNELNAKDRNNIIMAMGNIPEPQAGDNGKLWLDYGNQLHRIRQFQKSIVAYDKAIDKNQELLGNYGKAISLLSIQKYQLAENAIAQAIAQVKSIDRVSYYYFWKKQSKIFEKLEKYDLALKSIDLAISLESKDLTSINQKAVILSNMKQYPKAMAIYDEIIRRQPEGYAYYNRAKAKSEMGNHQAAIGDYDRSIDLNPKFGEAYYNRGRAKTALGKSKAAIDDYNRAIDLNPKDSQSYNNRGLEKSNLGDNLGAIADFDRVIALDPKDAKAYNNRGLAKVELGDKDGAIADFDRSIALNPKYGDPYSNRGNAKSARRDRKGAIADYDLALAIDPKDAETYFNRGTEKAKINDKQGAVADLNRAAELFRQQGRMDLYQRVINTLKII